MAIMCVSPSPASSLSFEFEVVQHWEYQSGSVHVINQSRSHSDPTGLAMVLNGINQVQPKTTLFDRAKEFVSNAFTPESIGSAFQSAISWVATGGNALQIASKAGPWIEEIGSGAALALGGSEGMFAAVEGGAMLALTL
jgi:hypothetical protein